MHRTNVYHIKDVRLFLLLLHINVYTLYNNVITVIQWRAPS